MREVVIATTPGCKGCSIMINIINNLVKEYDDIVVKEYPFSDIPEWLKVNVKFTDFPTTVFIKDNCIKYVVNGTKSVNKLKTILLNYL